MSRPADERCPCGSGDPYDRCCGPLHRGERPAPTAEALMRSRYSAFARGLDRYLAETWHPDTRPRRVTAGDPSRWRRLDVLDTEGGNLLDSTGEVEFIARHADGELHERSRFVRLDGRWVYLDARGGEGTR